MKRLVIILSVFLAVNAFAYETVLSLEEKKLVLSEIDNVCADIWCEGEFVFSFNDLLCNSDSGECAFSFEFIYYAWSDPNIPEQEPDVVIKLPVECSMSGFCKKSDIYVPLNKGGNTHIELTSGFVDAISKCVDDNYDKAVDQVGDYYNVR